VRRRCYNSTELKNKITKHTQPIQAKTHTATSAYVGKETRKKFRYTNLKRAFGTWKTKEHNLLHKRQNADLQDNSSAYQLKH
jgi:hypothetical protein